MLKIARIISGCLIGALALFLSSYRAEEQFFEVSKNIDILVTAFRELQANYVDEVDTRKTVNKGIQSMLSSLDPYTEFVPEEKIEEFKRAHLSSEYAGIGAYIGLIKDQITITEVYEGFPAQKAGFVPGDVLLKIDETDLKGKKSEEVSSLLKGPKNSTVKITVKRLGQTIPLVKSIKREAINTGSVSYSGFIENDLLYIRLDRFMEDAGKEVKNAILKNKNQHKINGIILDLRGNGGGILAEAVKICNLFIKQGTLIVSQKGKQKKNNADYMASEAPIDTETPLVVLVDRGSASASEIVAGAIQDTDRGVIIGQRTFGKGLVQNTVQVAYHSLLKLTIAKYYTPSGRCIQALDYTHKREDGSVEKVADSLISEFKTANGRLVYDGSGIYPDVYLEPREIPTVAKELVEQHFIFRFANEFYSKTPAINSASSFSLTDEQYQSFIEFVKSENFSYSTQTEQKIKSLSEAMKKDKIAEAETMTTAISKRLNDLKNADLTKHKKLISEIIEAEIALRYQYQKGRIESTFDDDHEIKEAISTLRNPMAVKNILNGVGEFKTIGKPKPEEKKTAALKPSENEED